MDLDGVHARGVQVENGSSLNDLPDEILEIIRLRQSPTFLETLTTAALQPTLTLKLFLRFEAVFADTCARWVSTTEIGTQNLAVIEAFARILPLAPHLSSYLETYLSSADIPTVENNLPHPVIYYLKRKDNESVEKLPNVQLQRILLAALRLLQFDKHVYSRAVSRSRIQKLFQHEDRAVRYLAIRIFCELHTVSELKMEEMILRYVGKDEAIMGDLDGELFDYGFLSLSEQKRFKGSIYLRRKLPDPLGTLGSYNLDGLSTLVVRYADTLLPRPSGSPNRMSKLVPTATTIRNMETFTRSLLSPSPILLHGLAGCGKTSLVNDFARELGLESKMVTMHLNEQTDAKMLIGMYAAGSKPGSFTWRPGVLTTAVREGRWVFIEDLDRAPNEIISVILPLIERGELLIPSRGETIKAGRGFRLLASIRTSFSITGQEIPPAIHMLGTRLWQRVHVSMPPQEEFREIIYGMYPVLRSFLPKLISVYNAVYHVCHIAGSAAKASSSRPATPRDLLKWSRRLNDMLVAAGLYKGDELISESIEYEMFKEAVDCFAGSLPASIGQKMVISTIAQEMHIAPERVEHFMDSYVPKYDETSTDLSVGRAHLSKMPVGRIQSASLKKPRPFANTAHAKRLLEQVGIAVRMSEPVLLVGETGIGKTTVVQQLADRLRYKLTVVNMSQQSEAGDLLGGFKPVNIRSLAIPLKDEFDELFAATGISVTKNQRYIEQLNKYITRNQWSKASRLWHEAPKMFEKIVSELLRKEGAKQLSEMDQPSKRRKIESRLQSLLQLKPRWERFMESLDQFDIQLSGGSKGFTFTFVEGNIVKAARNGDWVLLDEINLSSPDTLESIADLLHSGDGNRPSILLSETGEIERVYAHPNFRIFGAMNPATDVGKKDLPMGLRSRFTEIYVESPDKSLNDLLSVIQAYINGINSNDDRVSSDVAALYMNTKRLADEKRIVDGANQVPHFSLRTLTRVLAYATEIAPFYGLRRALYEGFSMGFLTLLNRESERMLVPLINHHLLDSHGNARALLAQTPRLPQDGRQYVRFTNKKKDRQYWMLKGDEIPQEQPHYIITPSVERNILNLVRATSTRRFPILLQGPTSAGKTSMIEYLAKFSGNKFVRINNHEHTDLQEYLGTYVTGSDGQLRFQEGLLVKALRQGHWIVLDELNLCPGDVLEALNRLLDDNRELLIPETQDIVRPHENFMLFATQNPAGLYGGRKSLSRAFRNRFLELHFDDIPEDELDIILEKRSQKVAPSDCKRIVQVYKELSVLRQSNRLFEQKDSFATLRDLFRWALRDADNREELAANGYMLLAERVRNPDEKKAVKEVIERVMKVKLDPNHLYHINRSPEITAYDATANRHGVVWTRAMRRIYVLVAHAIRNNEPVLLVGETGCGKTTVCQMLADAFGKELRIVNAHQNTETSDLIGAQRPVRNRNAILDQLGRDITLALETLGNAPPREPHALIDAYENLHPSDIERLPQYLQDQIKSNHLKSKSLFEWSDGSLVQAMKQGQFFLLDEISLASDSVLERMNSVLESHRTMLLAEKGVDDSFVEAAEGFQFFATMNPGGDYGKRELSPALRNRFTEIWVPSLSEHDDIFEIVRSKLNSEFEIFAQAMVGFAAWFGQNFRFSSSTSISVRDILAWVKFINGCGFSDPYAAILHGAAMVYIDTLGANPSALLVINVETIQQERERCLDQLSSLLDYDIRKIYFKPLDLENAEHCLKIGDFSIEKSSAGQADLGFAFEAPTTKLNAMRIMRGLQVSKPILVEGSPGVGKTTLVTALAKVCGKQLTRINLSDQTDLMDLFGSDIPVEGAEAGHFAWRDAQFLRAMQNGEWVLLDEINLAQQSVLEGLNACLDHRGEVYISELDQTFKRHPNFFVFAAQNPHHQGGGRKGLPTSFVNRFTVVYADVLKPEDMAMICKHSFPTISDEIVEALIKFVTHLEREITIEKRFGSEGGPWEFNLRDVLRWLQLLSCPTPLFAAKTPEDFLNLIFRQRFRTSRDREAVNTVFANIFGHEVSFRQFFHNISVTAYQVGMAYMQRDSLVQRISFPTIDIRIRLPEIESLIICIEQNIPCILAGPSGSGKSTLIEHVAAAKGTLPIVFPLNADIDTMDLVGGFEQVDPHREVSAFLEQLSSFLVKLALVSLPGQAPNELLELLELLEYDNRDSTSYFYHLARLLDSLSVQNPSPAIKSFAATCKDLVDRPMSLENARFEWVDGVLIKALEQGKWLILDNANLCSASVLDRLNSLLEPNGFLSINEHCGVDGEPRIIRPHPDFRIFLTMDPRFGELSRAMRNRAIEIFLSPFSADKSIVTASSAGVLNLESPLSRYALFTEVLESNDANQEQAQQLERVALDSLSWSDLPMLWRFTKAIRNISTRSTFLDTRVLRLCQHYLQLYQSEGDLAFRLAVGNLLDSITHRTDIPPGFKDAQIIHPLQNSPLVSLLQRAISGRSSLDAVDFNRNVAPVYWLAVIFEAKLDIYAASDAVKMEESAIIIIKPSKMNRFQRSLISTRVPAFAADSTVHVSNFLERALKMLAEYLRVHSNADDHWEHRRKVVIWLLQYWWDTFRLVTAPKFEEATFQAHLTIGENLLNYISSQYHHDPAQGSLVVSFSDALRTDFQSGFNLRTGLSMETLWNKFRPLVPSKTTTIEILSQMEALAIRLDKLKWKTAISLPEIGSIMLSLLRAYYSILSADVNGSVLIKTLEAEIEKIEATVGIDSQESKPFLSDLFETLRKLLVIETFPTGKPFESSTDTDMVILSNHPTVLEMHYCTSSKSSRPLQLIAQIWQDDRTAQPMTSTFSGNLLRKLRSIGEVDMKSLKLLEIEIPTMGERLALSSKIICKDHLLDLTDVLRHLLIEVAVAHGDLIGRTYEQFLESNSIMADLQNVDITCPAGYAQAQKVASSYLIDGPPHVQQVFIDHLCISAIGIRSSLDNQESRLEILALTWVHFAMGFIMLYVPDRPFDPVKRGQLERLRHEKMRETLIQKLTALKQFEGLFSGQTSNLRSLWVESQIQDLGEWSEILPEVARPEISELDQLQGEFTNLLKTVVESKPHLKLLDFFSLRDDITTQEIKLMHHNITKIIGRLSNSFQAYRDLTVPAINILRCLQFGLSLAIHPSSSSSLESNTTLALTKTIPFLGGGPVYTTEDVYLSKPMEYLAYLATTTAAKDVFSFSPHLRQSLFKTIHTCYTKWRKQLDADRLELESKSGLYRFRGSAEDEEENDEEEFNELFPSYDDEPSKASNDISSAETARTAAVELSTVHEEIFLGVKNPSERTLDLIRQISSKVGSEYTEDWVDDQQLITSALLPGALLLLHDKAISLSVNQVNPETYNFYVDGHLPEVRKLVDLIHQIQIRFRELQEIDEISHMQPLKDVLESCRELLEFRHTEPLAKVITKVEQIHKFMHEWQFGGWASRANSVLPLYNNLTSTIVNWRRLELSTWAKLFDMEMKNCDNDAKSWWFIAYQVVIAVPLSIESVDELRNYSQKLLQDLETYFSTAIIGQFAQRLRLLKQLEKHLGLLTTEIPSMSIIHNAIASFISAYAYYENPVKETIKNGRASLEKSMRDILLLASWKDTNIIALRDSAKRSHHKLFKLVRKFRSVLGQPVQNILNQGLPDENVEDLPTNQYSVESRSPIINQHAIEECKMNASWWAEKPKRFVNMPTTLRIMVDMANIPAGVIDAADYLDSFVGDIITSSTELRKLTPSILDEDNKIVVKHLKNRKRKLFADTMKELRTMGIKSNLGVDSLLKQDSMSKVLASTEHLRFSLGSNSKDIDYYFYKTLDLMDGVREAARNHSDDLNSAEVARSIGFLEGLLQTVLIQRNQLSIAAKDLKLLKLKIDMGKALWSPENYVRNSRTITTHADLLQLLPTILHTGIELVKIHANLGKYESEEITSGLERWRTTFVDYSNNWIALPKMPENVTSTAEEKLKVAIETSTKELRQHLRRMMDERQNIRFILEQMFSWTEISSNLNPNTARTLENTAHLDQKLSQTCDAIFVAIEKYKKTVDNIPTSTDEQGWLVKANSCISNSITSLHSDSIVEDLQQAFQIFAALDLADNKISSVSCAIFTVALPIIQQYYNILREAVTRYRQIHRASCKMSYVLAKTFNQISSQGFCTPSEKSETEEGKTEKIEGGTGLGDGEGAEDISKDIQDNEDLGELAQEPNENNGEEIQDEKDAIDMADSELEGKMEDGEENQEEDDTEGDEENGEDIDEESGDVDDLDPTAIDEKMWDGEGDQSNKEQESDKSKGKVSKDEQVASEMDDKATGDNNEGEEVDEEEMIGEEQGEEVKQGETEKHDPRADEEEALELPDEMELDGNDEKGSNLGSEDGIDDLSDVEDDSKAEEAEERTEHDIDDDTEAQEDQAADAEIDIINLDEDQTPEEDQQKTEEVGEKQNDNEEEQDAQNEDGLLRDRAEDVMTDVENAQPSDVLGVGEDQEEDHAQEEDQATNKAQRDEGGKGADSSQKNESSGQDGEQIRQTSGDAPEETKDEAQDHSIPQPFKKLGDVLEKWHRQQIKQQDTQESERQDKDKNIDLSIDNQEFQHLQDEEAEADTQAMGTATEDQVRHLNESMAIDSEMKEIPENFQPEEVEEDKINPEDVMDTEDNHVEEEQTSSDAYEGRAGAIIRQAQEKTENIDDTGAHVHETIEEDVEEVDNRLESTHLDTSSTIEISRSAEQARAQWMHYEALTRPLSLSLTEQLRLILAPTLATKMRGDFRTGKRLNIKRIIPYIASQYKRDKIWMRRSVPSKRSYQIMLAVDDSKSMGESGSGSLAFETLAMVSKSLSLLEVGEICVVGFGENVHVAHDFDMPFSSDAGPTVFQNFSFQQSRTDITKLVRESIQLFRAARAKASSSPADLWQIELIISDGVCNSSEHEPIRRLLREALEERIMMVFVIVDDVKNKKKGDSVMDLKEAKFIKDEMTGAVNVRLERYLDTFPFQYYLIVSDVTELPGVLATLLRQWFAEVVDS
ncbi:hypothetical protein B7463_g6350, partial [Scytalidium lignicola]